MSNYKTLNELVKDFPNKADREKQLKNMSNKELDTLINTTNNVQGKIYLKSFKKG